jgi:hypothetical protein
MKVAIRYSVRSGPNRQAPELGISCPRRRGQRAGQGRMTGLERRSGAPSHALHTLLRLLRAKAALASPPGDAVRYFAAATM